MLLDISSATMFSSLGIHSGTNCMLCCIHNQKMSMTSSCKSGVLLTTKSTFSTILASNLEKLPFYMHLPTCTTYPPQPQELASE